MEILAEGRRDALVAVPGELEHGRLEAGEVERRGEARRRTTRMEDQIGARRRCVGKGEAAAERGGERRARGIDVDELDGGAGEARRERRRQRADRPGADD